MRVSQLQLDNIKRIVNQASVTNIELLMFHTLNSPKMILKGKTLSLRLRLRKVACALGLSNKSGSTGCFKGLEGPDQFSFDESQLQYFRHVFSRPFSLKIATMLMHSLNSITNISAM